MPICRRRKRIVSVQRTVKNIIVIRSMAKQALSYIEIHL
jgi:hypothetical protein